MEMLMQLPLPLLHIMRDIRLEQLEEQKREMDKSMSTVPNTGGVPINPSGAQELMDELS